MKYQAFFQSFVITCLVVGLIIALSLRLYWTRGNDGWAYWSGNILMSLTIAFTGFVLIIRNIASLNPSAQVNQSKRIMLIVFGIFLVLMGIIILINQLRQLNAGCPAPGCIS
jgi:hypothetical protein